MSKRKTKRDPWFSEKRRRTRRKSSGSKRRRSGLSPTEQVGAEAFSGRL